MAHGHFRIHHAFSRIVVAGYDAVGGPEKAGNRREQFTRHPTRAGDYVIATIHPHVGHKYAFSRVRWGTPMRDHDGSIELFSDGAWRPLAYFRLEGKADEIREIVSKYFSDKLPGR